MKTNLLIALCVMSIALFACQAPPSTAPAVEPTSTSSETAPPPAETEADAPEQAYPAENSEPIPPVAAYPVAANTEIAIEAYPAADTAAEASETPVFQTTIGELVVGSSRLVDEANNVQAGPNEKILLLILTRPNEENLDINDVGLEEVEEATQGHWIEGKDGFFATRRMAGWIDDEFAMGFVVPDSTESVQLFWPGYDPVEIFPTK